MSKRKTLDNSTILTPKLRYDINKANNSYQDNSINFKSITKYGLIFVSVPLIYFGGGEILNLYKQGELPSFVYQAKSKVEQAINTASKGIEHLISDFSNLKK